MYYRLRAAWWKLCPPPIPSPFLHHPKFARGLEEVLAHFVSRARLPIEFGCLYGWTTNILASNLRLGVKLRSYDIFARASVDDVLRNLGPMRERVAFERLNIWHWLDGITEISRFDFMYVDVNNTELTFREIWRKAHYDISLGTPILIEGATRMRLNIPHKVVIKTEPGLGLLLP